MKTIVCEQVGTSFCMAAGTDSLADEDWNDCLQLIAKNTLPGSDVPIVVHAKRAGCYSVVQP